VSIFIFFLNKKTNVKLQPTADGKYELRVHVAYKYIGYLSILCSILFSIGALSSDEEGVLPSVILILILLGGSGLWCVWFYIKHRVFYDDEGIVISSMTHRQKSILWTQIKELKLKPISGYLAIIGYNDQIKIHLHLVGIKSLLEKIKELTDVEINNTNF